ncbi:MAG: alpha-amylase family glycosyl hydrolase [Prevotella sp.]
MNKKTLTSIVLMTLMYVNVMAQDNINQPPREGEGNSRIILHAWCWSFNTIRENLKSIAEAGFTTIQTPPAQHCIIEAKGDKGGGPQLYGHGRWYYHYQPTDWKIGNYQVGTRDDLVKLCDEAEKYGLKIIVDVLPNHTAIDDTRVEDALDDAVGGHENLYHENGFNEITDYNDRLQCTTGQMGGLPDVNTENPAFQHYYLQYVNDLIACGVRGFRYDTAKHIGLPSDPLDKKSACNDFWDVVTGRKAVNGLSMTMPSDGLFIYGEVLQDRNTKEVEYGSYLDLTASSYGHVLRNILNAQNWGADNYDNWCHPLQPSRLVTWVESHDTYCNAHESASIPCEKIRQAWAFLTARRYGQPLFYSRPAGSSPDNVWGDNVVGKAGNDEFRHPEVVAANKFRKAMLAYPEEIFVNNDKTIAEVCRGKKGAMIVNITDKDIITTIRTTLPNGRYMDAVHKRVFRVSKGILSGTFSANSSYVLYKK